MRNNVLRYKDFLGSIETSIEDNCLHGKILFIHDLVTYEANTVAQLKAEFESAVEDYLATCKKSGRQPNKPFKGTFNVRIGPELHQKLARYAALRGTTINDVVKKVLAECLENPDQSDALHTHQI